MLYLADVYEGMILLVNELWHSSALKADVLNLVKERAQFLKTMAQFLNI